MDLSPEHTDAGQALWQTCIDQLAQELPQQQFNTWIKPLQAIVSEDFAKVSVVVGNRFKLDWIRAQYASRISALLSQLYGQNIQLDFILAAKEPPPRQAFSRSAQETEEMSLGFAPAAMADNGLNGFKNRLNSSLCFDTLVEGTANRMARAAAMHVANVPGQLYNPLFIYGGVGLGKTHLMPRFYTFMPNNLYRMWLRLINAKLLTSSSTITTHLTCC
jgi:chromosomal replication initiator protein